MTAEKHKSGGGNEYNFDVDYGKMKADKSKSDGGDDDDDDDDDDNKDIKDKLKDRLKAKKEKEAKNGTLLDRLKKKLLRKKALENCGIAQYVSCCMLV
jgi:hypothetical protein